MLGVAGITNYAVITRDCGARLNLPGPDHCCQPPTFVPSASLLDPPTHLHHFKCPYTLLQDPSFHIVNLTNARQRLGLG